MSSTGERPWQDEETLRELYIERQMTQSEIADELGCGCGTVSRWLGRHEIKTRNSGERIGPWKDEETLREMYHGDKMSTGEIADEMGCTKRTIANWMGKHGIEMRTYAENIRNRMISYPPQLRTIKRGYEIFTDNWRGDEKQVYHHQMIAIAHGADPYEVFSNGEYHVHHENELEWDNRPDNLEFVTSKEHRKRHATNNNE